MNLERNMDWLSNAYTDETPIIHCLIVWITRRPSWLIDGDDQKKNVEVFHGKNDIYSVHTYSEPVLIIQYNDYKKLGPFNLRGVLWYHMNHIPPHLNNW